MTEALRMRRSASGARVCDPQQRPGSKGSSLFSPPLSPGSVETTQSSGLIANQTATTPLALFVPVRAGAAFRVPRLRVIPWFLVLPRCCGSQTALRALRALRSDSGTLLLLPPVVLPRCCGSQTRAPNAFRTRSLIPAALRSANNTPPHAITALPRPSGRRGALAHARAPASA